MKKPFVILSIGLATVLLLTAASCSSSGTTSTTNSAGNVTIVNLNVPLSNRTIDLDNTNATIIGPAATVSVTGSELKPSVVTIKVGESVTWTNDDTTDHWPVADPSTALPGLDSQSLAAGESFSYTFMKAGTWKYVDRLHPTMTGTVVVQ